MGRELTSHKLAGLNDCLTISVLDEPGQGNACHEYLIIDQLTEPGERAECHIKFQAGPIDEGVNGISNESLLAVVKDRLLGFQSGQFACRENEVALQKIREAMQWLQKRTRDRIARGVEGINRR